MRKAIFILLFGLLGLVFASSAQAQTTALIRFVHAVPDAPAIDIYINGQLSIYNLSYGEATSYLNAPAGNHAITVTATGSSSPLWQQEIAALEEQPQTFIAASADDLAFLAFDDDLAPTALGITRFKAIHAIDGGPAVDVIAGGDMIISGLSYGEFIGTFDIPANTYNFSIQPTGGGSALFSEAPFNLNSSTSQILVVYGTAQNPAALLLSAPVDGSVAGEVGYLRLAHTISGAPPVDVYADGLLLAPGLAFGQSTAHLSLPPGEYAVEINAAGTDNTILEGTLEVEAGIAITVAALGTPDDPAIDAFVDEIGGIDAETALITVLNSVPGESLTSVTLADGTLLADELSFGESAAVVALDPTAQDMTLELSISGQSATLSLGQKVFYGGVYYNAIVLPSTPFSPATVRLLPTGLAQSVGSAPTNLSDALVVEAPVEVEEEEPEAEEITITETEAPVVEAQPTAAPPTAPPARPPAITARVLLDPGINLQLRQYPNSEALSLGLAPARSVLEIIGREGPALDSDGRLLDPDYVDPAEGLPDNRDLSPVNTWIKFIYFTPDGGEISAWNQAQYLAMSGPAGERVRLADLPLVPANSPGQAVNTAITPPPILEDRVTVEVVNLDAGVNLNIRRTPQSDGEVLARASNGTVFDFGGVGQSGQWYFISYVTVDGGTVTGWVTTSFSRLLLNGEPATQAEVEAEGLLLLADEATERGRVNAASTTAAGAPAAPAPPVGGQAGVTDTEDTFIAEVRLNPNTNLNLRRTPNVNGEVLIRIPSGSSLVISGRTDTGNWLATSFEGVQGWVASEFVFLTFNGRQADLADVPVVGTDAPGTVGPGDAAPAQPEPAPGADGLLPGECPADDSDLYLPPRIGPGIAAQAIAPLRIYSRPSINGDVIGQVGAGVPLDEIVGGPICNQGFRWWLIQAGDVRGWVQESDVGADLYLIEPLN